MKNFVHERHEDSRKEQDTKKSITNEEDLIHEQHEMILKEKRQHEQFINKSLCEIGFLVNLGVISG
jgi:hypothetical protein